MQKLLSTLLTIIFFQTSIFAFPVSFVVFNNYNSNSLTATKTLLNLPNSLKETYYATTKASNVENLQQIGYGIGDKAYDYKENPMLLAKDATSLFISYDMYEARFNNDNMFYGSALVLGGLALDIAGAPIKAGKGIVKTANLAKGLTTPAMSNLLMEKGTVSLINLNEKRLYRVMSGVELNAVKETGFLRGGWEGKTYFTDSYFTSATTAKSKLSLEHKPEYIVEFRIKNSPNVQGGTKVLPDNGEFGKGREYYTDDKVEIEIINYQKFNK